MRQLFSRAGYYLMIDGMPEKAPHYRESIVHRLNLFFPDSELSTIVL
jgi:hypothetical protein